MDRKLYNMALEEIISDTCKFEKLNEDPTMKHEAALQRFLRKLKQKNFLNEIGNLATCDSHLTILFEVFTNHLLAENTCFTNHME